MVAPPLTLLPIQLTSLHWHLAPMMSPTRIAALTTPPNLKTTRGMAPHLPLATTTPTMMMNPTPSVDDLQSIVQTSTQNPSASHQKHHQHSTSINPTTNDCLCGYWTTSQSTFTTSSCSSSTMPTHMWTTKSRATATQPTAAEEGTSLWKYECVSIA